MSSRTGHGAVAPYGQFSSTRFTRNVAPCPDSLIPFFQCDSTVHFAYQLRVVSAVTHCAYRSNTFNLM